MANLRMDPLFTDILKETLAEARAPAELLPKFEARLATVERIEGCISSIITRRPNANGVEVVTVRVNTQLAGEEFKGVPVPSNVSISNGSSGQLTDQQVAELRRAQSGGFKIRYRERRNPDRSSTVLLVEVLSEKCAKSCEHGKDGDGESF